MHLSLMESQKLSPSGGPREEKIKVSELESKLENANERADSLTAQLSLKNNMLKNLVDKLKDAKASVKSLEFTCADQQKTLEELLQKPNTKEDESSWTTVAKVDSKKECRRLLSKVRELQKSNQDLRAKNETLQKDVDRLKHTTAPGESDGRIWKTKLCTYFQRGSCQWGKNCNFAHGDDELR